jgi:hypothetical protein
MAVAAELLFHHYSQDYSPDIDITVIKDQTLVNIKDNLQQRDREENPR